MSDVAWLMLDPAAQRSVELGSLVVVDDPSWSATIERVIAAPGLHVYLTDAQAREQVRLAPKRERTDQWLGSQVTVAGRADMDFPNGDRGRATPDSSLMFRVPRDSAAYTLEGGMRFQSVGYSLDLERACRLLDGEAPAALHALLAPDLDESRTIAIRADRAMRGLAANLFDRGLTGVLRRLMMEGLVIQLLALQVAMVQRQSPRRRIRGLSVRDQHAVHQARELLLADMKQPPSLGGLAVAVGLSEKSLNSGFRRMFGATTFEILRNERLDHARIVLQAGDVALKEVAFRVGYDHVTNFISAFRARFGSPPGRYLDDKSQSRAPPSRTRMPRRRKHPA